MAQITLDAADLPEIEEWEPGQRYELNLTVEQEDQGDGIATFNVIEATGQPADVLDEEETPPEEPLPSLKDSFDRAATDVLPPSTGEGMT